MDVLDSKIFAIVPSLKRVVLCAVFLPFAAPGLAAAQSLNLQQAIEAAFTGNPELGAARREIDVAQGNAQQAGLIPNPELSWEVEDTRRNTSITTVMLSQALEIGGKRAARIEVASRGQDAAGLELERRSNDLRADVIQAFYAAVRSEAGLDLARQSEVLAERGLQVAQARIRSGKSSPVEETRAQVQLAETNLLVRRAQTLRANSYRDLARVTGSSTVPFDRLEYVDLSPGKSPPATELLTAIKHSAELRLAEARIELGDAALGSERAQRIPNLTVSVGSQYSREDRERVSVVGLSMPLPIFNRNQGNVLAASRRAEQSRDLRNAVELRLRTQTQTALDQWAGATRDLESFNKVILPAAQSAVDVATRGFEMGKFGFLEVLDAQRTLIAARSQYLESLAIATDARVTVERIYGDLDRFSVRP